MLRVHNLTNFEPSSPIQGGKCMKKKSFRVGWTKRMRKVNKSTTSQPTTTRKSIFKLLCRHHQRKEKPNRHQIHLMKRFMEDPQVKHPIVSRSQSDCYEMATASYTT